MMQWPARVIAEFSFGNLPYHEAASNMRLFTERCLPTLQNDAAFATPKGTAGEAIAPQRAAGEGIFAPA